MASNVREQFLNAGLFWLRVLAGLGIAYHGYGKVFGGHVDRLAEGVSQMGLPMPLVFAWVAALSEFLGGILLIFGLGTRIAAFFIFSTMSVAAFIVHRADPLDVKELALAYWVVSGALMFTGAGSWSLDSLFMKKKY